MKKTDFFKSYSMIRIILLALTPLFFLGCKEAFPVQKPMDHEARINTCISIQETLPSEQFAYLNKQFNEVSNDGWYPIEDINEEEAKYMALKRWLNETTKVIELEVSSPSGDWLRIDNYCFNENDATVKISSDLRTFYGGVQVVRSWLYNNDGSVSDSSIEIIDMNTQEQIDPNEASYLDNPPYLAKDYKDLLKYIKFDGLRPNS